MRRRDDIVNRVETLDAVTGSAVERVCFVSLIAGICPDFIFPSYDVAESLKAGGPD